MLFHKMFVWNSIQMRIWRNFSSNEIKPEVDILSKIYQTQNIQELQEIYKSNLADLEVADVIGMLDQANALCDANNENDLKSKQYISIHAMK